jgi:hypothetical protein
MKKTPVLLLLLVLIVIASMACGGIISRKSSTKATPQATPNLQATIDEAVVSTCGARSGLQVTQDVLSAAATATATFLQSVPTPMPTVVVEDLSEDKLEALIADRIQLANKAAGLAAEKSVEAVQDGSITMNEQEILYTYWYYATEVIAYAKEAIVVYYDVYGDLAAETLAPLKTVDADFETISQQAQVVLPLLEQIGQALAQGLGQKDKVLRKIETAAEAVQSSIANAQGQVQTWTASLKPAAQERVARALAVKPKKVAKNRKAAITKASEYAQTVRTAFEDQKITQAELANISQQGANAAASLTKKGGTQLAGLADTVNEITTQIASGQNLAARANLSKFQSALPAKP